GVALVLALLHHVQHAGQAELLRGQLHAPRVQGLALLARPVGQLRRGDAPVVEQATLDVLVRRHHAIDILEKVQPWTIHDLVERADGDEARRSGCRHGCLLPDYSTSRSFPGAGSIATKSGRAMCPKLTIACPGASPGSRAHRPSSMPLTVLRSRFA